MSLKALHQSHNPCQWASHFSKVYVWEVAPSYGGLPNCAKGSWTVAHGSRDPFVPCQPLHLPRWLQSAPDSPAFDTRVRQLYTHPGITHVALRASERLSLDRGPSGLLANLAVQWIQKELESFCSRISTSGQNIRFNDWIMTM